MKEHIRIWMEQVQQGEREDLWSLETENCERLGGMCNLKQPQTLGSCLTQIPHDGSLSQRPIIYFGRKYTGNDAVMMIQCHWRILMLASLCTAYTRQSDAIPIWNHFLWSVRHEIQTPQADDNAVLLSFEKVGKLVVIRPAASSDHVLKCCWIQM